MASPRSETADRSRSRRPGRAVRDESDPGGRLGLPLPALAFLLAWALLLLLAPPAHNRFWGVNGFRSVGIEAMTGLLVAAAASLLVLRVRSRWLAAAIAVTLALVLAFLLRETIHILGDTQIRWRAMAVFHANMIRESIAEWSNRVHANPLDILVNVIAPVGLRRLGASLQQGVSIVSAGLAVAYFAGLWRAAGRLGVSAGLRTALCAAMALTGTLEAFACYAESAGLFVAAAAWFWAEMLAPLDRPRQALRTAGAWLVLALCHRLALIMLPVLAWRALGPPAEGDQPGARRRLLVFTGVALVVAAVAMALGGTGKMTVRDVRDQALLLPKVLKAVPLSDYLNTLALVAPLACLAPWLAGRRALEAFVRQPLARTLLAGTLVVLPVMWIVPANEHGLGAHRDWDLAVLGGLTLTVTAAALLASLPPKRLRGALLVTLPLLALGCGGWLLVNHIATAALLRAQALAQTPPQLIEPHEGNLHGWMGQRAMDLGEPAFAAPELERSFELNGNPRRAMLAAEAYMLSGNVAKAREMMARARATGPLWPTLAISADRLDAMIAQAFADSVQRAAPPAPGP